MRLGTFALLVFAALAVVSCGGGEKAADQELAAPGATVPFENVQASYPNEPNGFRHERWGAVPDEARGMKARLQDSRSGVVWHTLDEEVLRLGKVPVNGIVYGFSPEYGLAVGKVTFNENRYSAILEYLNSHFHTNRIGSQNSKIVAWGGTVTVVRLYDDHLIVVSESFLQQWTARHGKPAFMADIY